ncbi:MAG: PKD domain-containing protein [Carboxydocellales bacterium]
MRRLFLIFYVLLTVLGAIAAEASIETPNYSFKLGRYDKAIDTYHVGAGRVFWDNEWKKGDYWTDGPWSIYVGGTPTLGGKRVGSAIAFSDILTNSNNGYPLVGSDKWGEWVDVFGGERGYVLGQLNSKWKHLAWEIKTPIYGNKYFANISDIVVLCGGKGGDFNVKEMYSTFSKSTAPTSSLTASKTAVKAGESVTFTIKGTTNTYYNQYMLVSFAGAGTTYFTDKQFDGQTITTTQNVKLNTPGTYSFSLRLKDAAMRQADVKTIIIAVGAVVPPPPPVQPPPDAPSSPPNSPPEVNQPPIAKFSWPSYAYAGEDVAVDEYSVDYDGAIVSRNWNLSITDASQNLGQGGGKVNFNTPGNYSLGLTVKDDDGATDALTKSITVYKPLPTAIITTSGTLKENRKVILSSASSKAPATWTIDHTKDEWVIDVVSGGIVLDIKLGTKSGSTQEVLFKKAGVYRVSLRVTNAKGTSDWAIKDITVGPDLAPVTDFSLNKITYRNPADTNLATINLSDKSASIDGDTIAQRTWKYQYDSDNDGLFSDEAWVILDSANKTTAKLKTNKVGKYLFDLTAKEDFEQETIHYFILPGDYRTGDTALKAAADKIIEVKNIAPTTTFSSFIKPKVDIIFSQGYLNNYATKFAGMINNLEGIVGAKLTGKDIDYTFGNTAPGNIPQPLAFVGTLSQYDTNAHLFRGNYISNTQALESGSGMYSTIYDLGAVVDSADITNFSYAFSYWYNRLSVYASVDNVHWHQFFYLPNNISSGFWQSDWGNFDTSTLPASFRYLRFETKEWQSINFSINSSKSYSSSTVKYEGVSRKRVNGVGDQTAQDDRYTSHWVKFDLGKQYYSNSINKDDYIEKMTIRTKGRFCDVTWWWSADDYSYYNYDLHAGLGADPNMSNDHTIDYSGYWKSFLPLYFRYLKVQINGNALDEVYVDIGTNKIIPTIVTPTLVDIQKQAQVPVRTGAKKVIVSLAEMPYNDATATSLQAIADMLNSNNISLVAFTDVANTSSIQQLTSKVTNQKVITTTADMTVPLDQLADYIIASTPHNYTSGTKIILQGQALGFLPTYSDFENDPKIADAWSFVHTPTYLDNSSGFSIYHNQNLTTPAAVLDKAGKYNVKYQAQDDPATGDIRFAPYRLWSDPVPTALIVHRKPIANFTVTPGTINAVDTSYDPDFQFQRLDKGIVEWKWMWKSTTSPTWTIGNPSGIPALGDYNIHLEVKDVYGVWSDPIEKTVSVFNLNKPPVANFSWLPTVIYEGDTVAVTNLSTDPDGDALIYQWNTYDPSGETKTYTTKSIQLTNVQPGNYWLTLRVWDSNGATNVITKSFSVNPLGVLGHIDHTPQWNLNRIRYNQSKTGTDDNPRPYHVFFAIESFVLKADTTDTGLSTTKATSLQVDLLNKGETELLISNSAKTFWSGEMSRAYFENLADGNYTFRFTVTYSNGVVKTHVLTIVIEDSWLEYYNFHRTE